MKNSDECPVTEILVYDQASFQSKSFDARYKVIRPTQQGLKHSMVAVFTTDGVTTNIPVLQLHWLSGRPCLYTNDDLVYDDRVPSFHILERDGGKDPCRMVE